MLDLNEGPPVATGPPGDPNKGKYHAEAGAEQIIAHLRKMAGMNQVDMAVGGSCHPNDLVDMYLDDKGKPVFLFNDPDSGPDIFELDALWRR